MKQFLASNGKKGKGIVINADSRTEAEAFLQKNGHDEYKIVWESGPNTIRLKKND